jgi:hypothetical protein
MRFCDPYLRILVDCGAFFDFIGRSAILIVDGFVELRKFVGDNAGTT